MSRDLKQIKEKAVPILKKAGVTRSAIFGSYVHGQNKPTSDVDILIDLPSEKSLIDLVRIKLELEEALGREVDLVEYQTIRPLLRKNILGEQVRIL